MSGGGDTGTSYNPSQLGQTFGNKLTSYLNTPAPVFNQSLHTGLGENTQRGLGMMTDVASMFSGPGVTSPNMYAAGGTGQPTNGTGQSGNPFRDSFNATSRLVNSGGLTPGMQGDIDTVNGVTGKFDNLAQSLGGPGFAETGYRDIYNESSNPMEAPGYKALRDKLQNDVTQGVGQQFNANGRFGGGAYVKDLTDALTSSLGGMDYQAYNDAQNRRMSALSGYDSAFGNRFGQQMGALSGQMGGAGQSFGMGQTGIGNQLTGAGQLGQRYQDMLLPAETMTGVGGIQDQNSLAQRLGEFDLFNRRENANYDRFSQLLGQFNGSQGNAGMSEQTPWWQSLLGAGLGIAGMVL